MDSAIQLLNNRGLAIWASQRILFDPIKTFCLFYIYFITEEHWVEIAPSTQAIGVGYWNTSLYFERAWGERHVFAWVAILIKRRITPPLVEPLFSQNFPHFFGAETRMEELTRLQASRRGHRGHLTKLMKKSEEIFAHRNDMTNLILASAKSTRDRL